MQITFTNKTALGKITFVTRFLPSENKVYTYSTYIHTDRYNAMQMYWQIQCNAVVLADTCYAVYSAYNGKYHLAAIVSTVSDGSQ